jgi:hypothetical protein
MTEQGTLEPSEQKTIIFYDDELTAVKLADGDIYVPVRRLCDNLGLTWSSQYMRIQRDEVLSDSAKTVLVTRTVKPGERGGGAVETVCLPLDLIPGWLFGVQTSRVREEIRPKLIRYRRECFRVLWDAFKQDILPTLPAPEMSPAEQALAQVEALYSLARQQVALERWLVHHDARLDTVEDATLRAHERLDRAAGAVRALQLRVYGPGQVVGEEQASEMAELVKAIAHTLTEQNPAGGNYYQSVWSELHRRYGVTTYRRVPADHFADVIAWLEQWLESLRQGGQDA